MKALEELFPDFPRDLVQAGALPVNHGCELLLEFPGMDRFPRREWDWLTYSLSRPLIELTMRRRVERQGNITLRGGCRVLEIVGRPDGALVTGVRCDTVSGPEIISADLVVDASKHGGLTLSFLKSAGRGTGRVQSDCDVPQASRGHTFRISASRREQLLATAAGRPGR